MIRPSPTLLIAAFVAILATSASAGVKISFVTKKVPFKDYVRDQPVMVVDNGEMLIDFSRNTYWTVREITFKGVLVGQASGGTGAVVTWDGEPIGTVHAKGDIHEYLTSVDLILDGKTIPLWADGKEQFTDATTYEGKTFEMVKKSTLGPMKHQAHFTLKDGSNALVATNDFEATVDIPAERFKGYRYSFMHMMPLVMTEWMRVEPDSKVVTGTTKDDPATKPRNLFTLPARGLAMYGPEKQTGIAYFYPAGAPALSEYGIRPGKDSKYRAMHFDKDSYALGEKRSWTLTVEPFTATPEEWVKTATALIEAK